MGKENGSVKFHPEVLRRIQGRVLRLLGAPLAQRRYFLGGGTAIAIHLGHRRSIDLDWFTVESMGDPMMLARDLRENDLPFHTGAVDQGTLHGSVTGVKVSFLEYRYPLLVDPLPWQPYGCELLALDDLACMKLSAIAQRGSKKDFADIYALGLKHRPLPEMFELYREKYRIEDVGHLIFALAYFDDADRERTPIMLWDTDWREIKRTIRGWVVRIVEEEIV